MKGLLLNYRFGLWDAVLAGKKTNTRRAHKSLYQINERPNDFELLTTVTKPDGFYVIFKEKEHGKTFECRARYQVGEVSFLQEPVMNLNPFVTKEDTIMYQYRDQAGLTELDGFKVLIDAAIAQGARWNNKMFMPEAAARFYIKIKRIEIERLKDISEADCIAEGIGRNGIGFFYTDNGVKQISNTAQKAYFRLYNAINKQEGPHNPWVFSYHFELCTANG